MIAVALCRRCDNPGEMDGNGLCPTCSAAVDRAFEASRPRCIACGAWDETVAMRPVTRTTAARLCLACGSSDEVLTVLAEEE